MTLILCLYFIIRIKKGKIDVFGKKKNYFFAARKSPQTFLMYYKFDTFLKIPAKRKVRKSFAFLP